MVPALLLRRQNQFAVYQFLHTLPPGLHDFSTRESAVFDWEFHQGFRLEGGEHDRLPVSTPLSCWGLDVPTALGPLASVNCFVRPYRAQIFSGRPAPLVNPGL